MEAEAEDEEEDDALEAGAAGADVGFPAVADTAVSAAKTCAGNVETNVVTSVVMNAAKIVAAVDVPTL
ncbi:hypothetical protein [Pandoraea sp. ISTKB]|uniref:hypothetical protein n=1 Tax=Pandoraea sp. ISTKB TaxID=1586708 RepID=UPI00086BE5A0|nr:hypothetical protein [Pandoraea sp. ISTKB]ODP33587.1 hypothetical protein A9762_17885 [Pandoraea sp. ISTKB]